MKASTDISTQERKRRENQEKAKRNEKHEIITDRIERGVASALHKFGLLFTAEKLEKVEKLADKIDKRQEELAKAEWQSVSARASTLGESIKKNK